MTAEELEICSYELRRRGYIYQARYGSKRDGWFLFVRKTRVGSPGWYRDATHELRDAADLLPYMGEPTRYR